jgi:hypothetical protein
MHVERGQVINAHFPHAAGTCARHAQRGGYDRQFAFDTRWGTISLQPFAPAEPLFFHPLSETIVHIRGSIIGALPWASASNGLRGVTVMHGVHNLERVDLL